MFTITLNLHTLNLSTRFRRGKNPFTGEVVRFPLDDGLSSAEIAALRMFLKQHRASQPDPDGYRKIDCKDGGVLRVCCGNLEHVPVIAMGVEIDGAIRDAAGVLFAIAQAANMAFESLIKPDVAALINESANPLVKDRWPRATITPSPSHLEKWIRAAIIVKR